ncbi:MAG: neutral/alkaline non-lysosomal ceramidase N-terminal domain-containing protein [Verrucomicrobiota bacterium]
MSRRILFYGLIVAVVLSSLLPLAQAAEWKAGLAAAKITPEAPVAMAGYASRKKPSEGVEADLFAKVLALEDRNGQRAVWITSDLIGFRAAVTEPMFQRIMQRTGLKRHQLLVNSSHTHTGPAIAASDSSAYSIQDEASVRTREYAQMLQDRIAATVEQALAKMEPVELSHGIGFVPFVMNRREFTKDKGVILGFNPRGPADRSMPLLKVSSPDGKLRAVIFGAACHNTTLGGDVYRISGDYAGFAQAYVQKQMPGVQAMFMQGCAGDANPYPRGNIELARQHGETLGKEVLRVLETKLAPVRGPLNLQFDYVDIPLAPVPPRAEIEKMIQPGSQSWRPWMAGKMLEALDKGEKLPTHYRAPIAVWQFGKDLTLVALSGEVVVDFVHLTEKAIGPLQLWIAAYSNDVFGYLPSARVLSEGGYETRGLIHGGIGFFSPQSQDAVIAKVKELAEKARR